MARIVELVKPKNRPELQTKRVCAYARVSSGKDSMLHSLSAQVSYFQRYIHSHVGWKFAGVYADEALTGTKGSREQFQEMIKHSLLCLLSFSLHATQNYFTYLMKQSNTRKRKIPFAS